MSLENRLPGSNQTGTSHHEVQDADCRSAMAVLFMTEWLDGLIEAGLAERESGGCFRLGGHASGVFILGVNKKTKGLFLGGLASEAPFLLDVQWEEVELLSKRINLVTHNPFEPYDETLSLGIPVHESIMTPILRARPNCIELRAIGEKNTVVREGVTVEVRPKNAA